MQTVVSGDQITFTHTFRDASGDPYDPAEIEFRIAKNATTFLSKTYSLSAGDVTQTLTGQYMVTYPTSILSTPSLYNARWDAEINGVDSVHLETFQIVEATPEASGILDAPRLYGVMMESALYNTLGVGDTDRLFLIGHADGLTLNDPYQVSNMQEAVNLLGASHDSPMLRALLECYNTGARDIWLVAAAPEGEYVPFDINDMNNRFVSRPEWGQQNFYERYYDRLIETYEILEEFDYPELVVPVEAPAFDAGDVDFVGQLADHCMAAYENTSSPRIGIIGTRLGNLSDTDIQDFLDDPRFDKDYGDAGKFVMITAGEAVFRFPQMPISHISSVNVVAAATLAQNPMNLGLTYRNLRSVMVPYGRPLTKSEYRAMAQKKINPLIRTSRGKRGVLFESVLATDNTLSSDGSDFWSVVNMRLVSKVIQEVRALGNRFLGTIGLPQFKEDVNSYLRLISLKGEIRGFNLQIDRDPTDIYKVIVDIALSPFAGVREIAFQVKVGPGA